MLSFIFYDEISTCISVCLQTVSRVGLNTNKKKVFAPCFNFTLSLSDSLSNHSVFYVASKRQVSKSREKLKIYNFFIYPIVSLHYSLLCVLHHCNEKVVEEEEEEGGRKKTKPIREKTNAKTTHPSGSCPLAPSYSWILPISVDFFVKT